MSDTPAVDAGNSPPPERAPGTGPVAGGNVPPVAAPVATPSTSTPVPTPPAPNGAGDLDYDTQIRWNQSSGQEQTVPLGELTSRYDRMQEVSDADLKQYRLFQAAAKGNVEAGKELVGLQLEAAATAAPSSAPVPGAPPSGGIEALQQKVEGLERQLAGTTPIVGQIQQAQEIGMFKRLIEEHKIHLPHLSHHPQAAQRVQVAWVEARRLAAASNVNLDRHPRAKDVLAQVLRAQEDGLAQDVAVFQGFDAKTIAPGAAPPPPGTEAVMPPAAATDGQLPPGAVGVLGGVPVNSYGRPVAVPRGTGAPMPVPGGIPTPSDRAVTPGHDAGLRPAGPMGREQFQELIKQRAVSMGGE